MSYTSYTYLLLFLGITFLAYTAMPKKFKWTVLLTASYAFYWINSKKLLAFLLITTIVVYLSALWIDRIQSKWDAGKKAIPKEDRKPLKAKMQRKKKAVIFGGLAVCFGILLYLKYYNFFGGTLNHVFSLFHMDFSVPWKQLILPLGISYYTLMAASYVIDVYRGKYRADKNFFKIALFLGFFPQIVEGPLGRYDQLADQAYEGHKFSYENLTFGIQLIFWGLFKKLIIADRANAFVATIFDNYRDYSGLAIALATVLYTLQIYAEFSGCMDIVTGSAQLFGVSLANNFDRPFFSKSVNEFWRRWHITLGAWLRDYIFYSVSLSKCFQKLSRSAKKHLNEFLGALVPSAFALFFVWFANGFWHGASWKYVTYGLYYYVIMMAGMLCEPLFRRFFAATHINRDGKIFSAFRIFRTFIIVNLGMMMFRAKTLPAWGRMVASLFRSSGLSQLAHREIFHLGMDAHDFVIVIIATIVMIVVSVLQERGHSIRHELAQKHIAIRWPVYFALILAVIIFGAYGVGYEAVDFIYGQF